MVVNAPQTMPPTGIVTILFTDIVGSTALRNEFIAKHGEIDGDSMYREQILEIHNARIRSLLKARSGFEVKTNGDSFMAAFEQASPAVQCAAEIQRSFKDKPINTTKGPLSVRIGMNTGQLVPHSSGPGWDYDGHAVSIASRIQELFKGGGQILCSQVTHSIAGNYPAGIGYNRCGIYNSLRLELNQALEVS